MLSPPRHSSSSTLNTTIPSPGRIYEIVPDVAIAQRTRSTLNLEEHRITDLEKYLDDLFLPDDGAEDDFEEYEKFLNTLSNTMEETPSR